MSSQSIDEERIFHVARDIANPDSRVEYLDQICAGDQALRERVEALLRVHEQEQSFLKSGGEPPPTEGMGELNIAAGQQIGRYKLLQKIGEGGFGVVFMAEQSRPVRRKVALKVIKPGMDSQAVVARFEAERQALAMMDHPNIARVFDGGANDSGRPYFVMELVKGVPITEYCDKNELSTEQRLKLFTTVCQAVQHAHQKGIIHRDLKPSNVLVTLADGQPVVKVIDFGVAKATNQQLTEKTLFTAFGQMVGTPQYMSPEQAEMSCLDVDTRSDVYSLGVLLYELLTGTTPLEAERLRTAGYAEMQRLIREEEPPKPSTRLSTSGEKLTVLAKHRKVTPEKLKSQVKGDLDWIVMKALEKDRNRRYESPASLGDDVGRVLSDEPVEACPPSQSYRLRKFVRRNRLLVSTASVVMVALLCGLGLALWGMKQAEDNAKEANRQKERANKAVIERLMLQAVAGELKGLRQAIGEARDLGVPEDWLLTLEGVSHVHRGEINKAVAALEVALDDNPHNISAKAMLSFAYFLNGNWEEWYLLADELKVAEPRDEYDEFDRLFLGYGWFYIEYKQSVQYLEPVLREHPTWYIPRAVLAIAWSHAARYEWSHDNDQDGEKYAKAALEEIEVPQVLIGDNPFVLTCCFYVYHTAAEFMKDDQEANRLEAQELAKRLSDDHPDYVIGSLLRAQAFELYKETSDAQQAWKDMLTYGNGTMHLWPAAAFLNGYEDEGFDVNAALKQKNDEWADLARAYVLALSEDEVAKTESLQIFDRLKSQIRTWFGMHTLIQIPLLAGEPGLARQQSLEWIENASGREGIDNASWWEKECIYFLATGIDRGLDWEAQSPGEKWFANYQRGMLAISKGRMDDARKHFSICKDDPYYPRGGFRRFWAVALDEHLRMKLEIADTESEE